MLHLSVRVRAPNFFEGLRKRRRIRSPRLIYTLSCASVIRGRGGTCELSHCLRAFVFLCFVSFLSSSFTFRAIASPAERPLCFSMGTEGKGEMGEEGAKEQTNTDNKQSRGAWCVHLAGGA